MKLTYARFIALLFLISLVASTAGAESKSAVVDQDDQILRESPNGTVLTPLRRGTPVRILEEKEDWVKVSIDGWMRSASLRAAQQKSTANPAAVAAPVSVVGFSIEKTPGAGSKLAQAQIVLKIRNNLSLPLAAWKAILVVQKHSGELLFSSAVSDDRPFAAGSTAEVKYYWEDGEEQYTKLTTTAADQLKVNLLNVEVTKQ